MTSSEFTKLSRRQATQAAYYIADQVPVLVVRETLRFVDNNFRTQSWHGYYIGQPWAAIKRRGTILVKTGRLRRGMQYSTNGRGEVRFFNNVPYAKVHNEGFNGTVTVRGFTRARYQKSKVMAVSEFTPSGRHKQRTVTNKVSEHQVKSFTRKMKIIQRQFMPYEGHESVVLNDTINRETNNGFKRIFKV